MHATSPGTLHRPTHNCMQYIFYSWGILTRVIGLFCFILLISPQCIQSTVKKSCLENYWKLASCTLISEKLIFENIHWALFEVAEVSFLKFHQIKKQKALYYTYLILTCLTSKMVSKPQRPKTLPSWFYLKLNFWNQWLLLIKVHWKLSFLTFLRGLGGWMFGYSHNYIYFSEQQLCM